MLLTELLKDLIEDRELAALPALECTQLTSDSRAVRPGALFLAYCGLCSDGKQYVRQAVERGAVAVLADAEPAKEDAELFDVGMGMASQMMAGQLSDADGAAKVSAGCLVPYLVLPNLKELLVTLADRFYYSPQRKLTLYGVTGTNGKTSVSYYLAQMLQQLGVKSAVIGTTGWGELPNLAPSANTTPGIIELRAMLAELVERGVQAVVMEVSSHGLVQGRVQGLYFQRAIFTNLTQDHLDYHGDMQNYAAAKFQLFAPERCAMAVVNVADACGANYCRRLAGVLPMFTYAGACCETGGGVGGRAGEDIDSEAGEAELRTVDAEVATERSNLAVDGDSVRFLTDGLIGVLRYREPRNWLSNEPDAGGQQTKGWCLQSPLIGNFNLENIMAAIATLLSDGYRPAEVLRAASSVQAVKGRMEVVRNRQVTAKMVVVDYAHTPDALAKALTSLRDYCGDCCRNRGSNNYINSDCDCGDCHDCDNNNGDSVMQTASGRPVGRLWVVFGCGGDRDRGKRAQMGQIAGELADMVIVTSDNPRSEPAMKIIEEICAGIGSDAKNGGRIMVESDRAQAIRLALQNADERDVILIAGKGHEEYQIIGGVKHYFSDQQQVLAFERMTD